MTIQAHSEASAAILGAKDEDTAASQAKMYRCRDSHCSVDAVGTRRGSEDKTMETCCTECFLDPFLKQFVESHGVLDPEPCEYCGASDTHRIDPVDLADLFMPVVSQFYCHLGDLSQGQHVDPLLDGDLVGQILDEDFEVFSDVIDPHELLKEILRLEDNAQDGFPLALDDLWARESLDWENWSLEEYVSVLEGGLGDYGHSFDPAGAFPVGENAELRVSFETVKEFLKACEHPIDEQEVFWRARRGEHEDVEDVLPPPPELCSPGRANVSAERVLYVANDPSTALAEARPSIGESVTLVEYKTKRPVYVCRLIREEWRVSPFEDLEKYVSWLERQEVKGEIGSRFAAPIRPSDTSKEYVFTQYIARMVRQAGMAGIQYGSSQSGSRGENLVLFDPGLAEPTGTTEVRTVEAISYTTRLVP